LVVFCHERLNYKYIDVDQKTQHQKLETIAFSSNDFDFLAISYPALRPIQILYQNLIEVIESIRNRKILTKSKLFGEIPDFVYQKLKISRLVLKSYNTSIDIRHSLCFLPENSFSTVQVQSLLKQNAQDLADFKAKKLKQKQEQERIELQQLQSKKLELLEYEKYLREKYFGHDIGRLFERIRTAKNAHDHIKVQKLERRF
jgi:hypothetical protein